MADIRSTLGEQAMESGDYATEQFGEIAEMGACLIVMDLVVLGEDGAHNHITYHCNDPRMWIQEALLAEALDACIGEREHRGERRASVEEDEDE